MTDDRSRLPGIPAEAVAPIIAAAAEISGKAAGDLDLEQATQILKDSAKQQRHIMEIIASSAGRSVDDLTPAELLDMMSDPAADQRDEEKPIKKNPAGEELETRAYFDAEDEGRDVIRIATPKRDPALDPTSDEVDWEKWEECQQQAGEDLQAAAGRMRETLAAALRPLIAGGGKTVKETFADAIKTVVAPVKTAAQEYYNSDAWKTLREALREVRETLETIETTAPGALELVAEIEELSPYLDEELQKPEYEGKTIDELLAGAKNDDGNPLETSLFMRALTAARAARDAAAAKEEPSHAAVKRAEIIEYPLDKPNSIIWNLLEKDTRGQVSFNMAKYGSKQQIPAYYAINFDKLGDDITITKRLLPFDKRVYIAVSALFNAGNNVITLSQIYYAMGYTGRPAAKHLTKINDAITKMTGARIFFDNEQEAAKYKYTRFKYDGSLLPLERGTAIVNGQLTDAAIHIFREPPLITFAKQRKQITSIDVKLLQSPINKTDANLQIDDYLIERISKAKNRKTHSCRILFKTLYAKTGIATKKQEQRAPDKIKRYLEHYQQEAFITRFTMEKDGITVHW